MGICLDWISKEAWERVRVAFNSLTDDEKQAWQAAASSHNLKARAMNKSNTKWLAVGAGSVGSDSLAVSSSQSTVDFGHPQILNAGLSCHDPAALKEHTGCVGDFLKHLAERFSSAGSTLGQVSPWPIGESNILSALLSLRLRKIPLRDTVKSLKETCQATAGPKSDDDIFPEKVMYHQHCQGICGSLGFDLIRYQSKIVESLNYMAVSRYKRPADLVRDDLVLLFDVKLSNMEVTKEFYLVTATAFQGGIQKPVQSYIRLHPKHNFEEDGLLEFVPAAHVPSIRTNPWPSPIQRAYEGSYGCYGAI